MMEKISSFMDGELDADDAGRQIARLQNDTEARANWDAFHLIGDAMRGDCVVTREFSARLHARLAEEPTVLAPRRSPARPAATYLWPAAASFAAVALVGWIAFYSPLSPQLSPQPQIAAAPPAPQPAPAVELANVPSDGRMNEYLMAHQAFSPSTAIQGLAPYIRTVSATQPQKGAE